MSSVCVRDQAQAQAQAHRTYWFQMYCTDNTKLSRVGKARHSTARQGKATGRCQQLDRDRGGGRRNGTISWRPSSNDGSVSGEDWGRRREKRGRGNWPLQQVFPPLYEVQKACKMASGEKNAEKRTGRDAK